MKLRQLSRVFMAPAAVLLVFVSCSEQPTTPLTPSDTVSEWRGGNRSGAVGVFRALRRASRGAGIARVEITAEGGTISTNSATLIIPPGAVTEPVTITMLTPGGPFAAALFWPHGLEFDQPAKLMFSLEGTKLGGDEPLYGVYIDERRGSWFSGDFEGLEYYEAVVEDGMATFPIEHFSGYITSSGYWGRSRW